MANEIIRVVVEADDNITHSLTKDNGVMIRNVSNVRAKMFYSEPLGSTYEIVIRNGNNETYSTEDGTLTITETSTYNSAEVVFPKATSNVFYFEIKNSGASGSYTVWTQKMGLVDYVFPTCKVTVEKEPNTGIMTVNITGNYFSGYFDSDDNVGGDNSMYVQYRYKEAGTETWGEWIDVHKYNTTDSQWTDTQVYVRYNKYTAKITIRGLDPNTVYAVEARIIDRVGDVTSKIEYGYSKPIFDWSAHDFNFNVPVYTNGAMQINGDLNVIGKITQNGVSTGGGVNSLINITYHAVYTTNSIIAPSGHSYCEAYIIQPFNLVLLNAYFPGLKNPLPNSTSYVKLCDFEQDFWPKGTWVLSVSGTSRNAILDINGNLKIKFPEGASTEAELYISGIYALSQLSSYYKK